MIEKKTDYKTEPMTEDIFDEMKESALKKWSEPEEISTTGEARIWWRVAGGTTCSFCQALKTFESGCARCPLNGNSSVPCTPEWDALNDLIHTERFTLKKFHKLSTQLKKRIAAVKYEEVRET